MVISSWKSALYAKRIALIERIWHLGFRTGDLKTGITQVAGLHACQEGFD
jgi:hypothetical protein